MSLGACPTCGTEFHKNRATGYCSTACRDEARLKRQRERKPPEYAACFSCGKEFAKKTAWQEFCSAACRLAPDPEDMMPDLFAQGWTEGRQDAIRDLRPHLPHDGDPCELCNVLDVVLKALQGVRYRGESCPPAASSPCLGLDHLTDRAQHVGQLAKMRRAYDGLDDAEFESLKAGALEKGEPPVPSAHTNGIESFWAALKRGYHGTYHHMSVKHLGRYVGEFEGRHNDRPADTVD